MNVAVPDSPREMLRRKLPPGAYRFLRFSLWLSRYCFPRLVESFFIRRTPKVQEFPAGRTSEPVLSQIRGVNVLAPTKMCRVMTWHGSDKGKGRHNYTTVYSKLFGKLREKPLRIFELGLGTSNPRFSASMGVSGLPGASLRGWRELFPNATVFGADIDREILFEEDRIKTFYCDQLDSMAIRDLWSQPPLQGGMDIIIDDGMHTFEGNTSFLEGSIKHLLPGGTYVVEDILESTISLWQTQVEAIYSKQFPNYAFAVVMIPASRHKDDNNLLIVRRRD